MRLVSKADKIFIFMCGLS